MFSRRVLGSVRGKHCKSSERNIYGERLLRRPKKDILEKDHRYFVAVLSEMD